MGTILKLRKYIIWGILFYIFTMFMMYVGFNSTYKNMEQIEDTPEQMQIEVAQSTKVNGRIFGKVTSTEENDLNGKYIKIQIYDKRDELIGVKYLKIEDTQINEPKKFVVYFTAENIKSYKVELLDDNDEIRNEMQLLPEYLREVFTVKELARTALLGYVILSIFM